MMHTDLALAAPPPRPAWPAPRPEPGERVALGAVTLERHRGETAATGERCFQLLVQLAGTSSIETAGGRILLPAGHWHAHDAAGRRVLAGPGSERVAVRLAAGALSGRIAGLMGGAMASAEPLDAPTRVLLDLARSALTHSAQLEGAAGAALGESLVELVRLALIERRGPARVVSVRETVRARIESFVQRNLADPELSIDLIARRMKCTKRYLHKVFSEDGETLSHFIWAQRLERCRADLARAELAERSITEIAFGWGFSNAAHFSRSFRAHFSQSPREYRVAQGRMRLS